MATPTPSERVCFDVFEADLRSGELRKQGIKIKLHRQPFQVLTMLLEHPGEVVTREELKSKLWPLDTFVDFDVGLNSAVKKLRDALGDSAEIPRYVETLPRRGYRFIGSLSDTASGAKLPSVLPEPVVEEQSPAVSEAVVTGLPTVSGAHSPWMLWATAAVLAGLLVSLAVLDAGGWREKLLARTTPIHIRSIAVLPLENLSGDPEQEYFADGMTEAVTTDLGRIGGLGQLRVISRTSAMHYKDRKKTVPEIARELNVDAVVEGAVLRSGNRVRITAQLIQAVPEKHLWAETYERDLQDILALQSDVARAIAAQVQVTLTPQQQARLGSAHSINPDVHRAILKAKFFFNNQRSSEGARKAVEYSLEATRLDPNSASAFTTLAESYDAQFSIGEATYQEALPQARAAGERAVALDPDLGEAHSALGDVLSDMWDWQGAEREVKRALELNPSDAHAHGTYAWYLVCMGRTDEAVAEAKQSRELDPLSLLSNRGVGMALYFARRYDEALVELQQTAEMFPNSPLLFNWLSRVYLAKENNEKAVEMALRNWAIVGVSPEKLAALRRAFEKSGMRAYWEEVLKLARAEHRVHWGTHASIALGKYDEAFEWLEKSYQEHGLGAVKVDPTFDSIRSDPRFQDLLRRIGLLP
jgi:TolB-like protein/DNA-binding winged helix-turn-helix (wHTH) protein/Flp pilus assembly protein TadD